MIRWWAAVATAVTPLGRVALGVGVGALLAWTALGWREFAPVAGAIGVMFLLSALALAGSARDAVRLELPTPRVRVGDSAEVQVRLRSRRTRSFGRTTTVTVTLPDGEVAVESSARGAVAAIPLSTGARGVYRIGPAVIGRHDPLLLLQRRWHATESLEQFVHPTTVALPAVSAGFFADLDGFASRELTARDIAFHSVREYTRGDEMRMVHWRSTAKSGTVMVRQFEQSRRSSLTVLLDGRAEAYSEPDGFELAVSAVGSLAERGVREGRTVTVAVTAPGGGRILTGALLDELARLEPGSEADGLAALARRLERTARDSALVALVCGDGTAYPSIAAAARPFRARSDVIAVRCEPGADPSFRGSLDPPVLGIGLLGDLARAIGRAGVR